MEGRYLNGGAIQPCSKPADLGWAGKGGGYVVLLARKNKASKAGLVRKLRSHVWVIYSCRLLSECFLLNLLPAFIRGHHLLYEFFMWQDYISHIKCLAAIFNLISLILANYLLPN